jgi:hypothetical protein
MARATPAGAHSAPVIFDEYKSGEASALVEINLNCKVSMRIQSPRQMVATVRIPASESAGYVSSVASVLKSPISSGCF